MQAVTRGWPPERRKKQAENARRTRPWLCSTGPKTPEGKARTRMNGEKRSRLSARLRFVRSVLAAQRRFLKIVKPLMNPDLNPAEYQLLKRAIIAGSAYQTLQLDLHNLTFL
jgi:hypothetical protein